MMVLARLDKQEGMHLLQHGRRRVMAVLSAGVAFGVAWGFGGHGPWGAAGIAVVIAAGVFWVLTPVRAASPADGSPGAPPGHDRDKA